MRENMTSTKQKIKKKNNFIHCPSAVVTVVTSMFHLVNWL